MQQKRGGELFYEYTDDTAEIIGSIKYILYNTIYFVCFRPEGSITLQYYTRLYEQDYKNTRSKQNYKKKTKKYYTWDIVRKYIETGGAHAVSTNIQKKDLFSFHLDGNGACDTLQIKKCLYIIKQLNYNENNTYNSKIKDLLNIVVLPSLQSSHNSLGMGQNIIKRNLSKLCKKSLDTIFSLYPVFFSIYVLFTRIYILPIHPSTSHVSPYNLYTIHQIVNKYDSIKNIFNTNERDVNCQKNTVRSSTLTTQHIGKNTVGSSTSTTQDIEKETIESKTNSNNNIEYDIDTIPYDKINKNNGKSLYTNDENKNKPPIHNYSTFNFSRSTLVDHNIKQNELKFYDNKNIKLPTITPSYIIRETNETVPSITASSTNTNKQSNSLCRNTTTNTYIQRYYNYNTINGTNKNTTTIINESLKCNSTPSSRIQTIYKHSNDDREDFNVATTGNISYEDKQCITIKTTTSSNDTITDFGKDSNDLSLLSMEKSSKIDSQTDLFTNISSTDDNINEIYQTACLTINSDNSLYDTTTSIEKDRTILHEILSPPTNMAYEDTKGTSTNSNTTSNNISSNYNFEINENMMRMESSIFTENEITTGLYVLSYDKWQESCQNLITKIAQILSSCAIFKDIKPMPTILQEQLAIMYTKRHQSFSIPTSMVCTNTYMQMSYNHIYEDTMRFNNRSSITASSSDYATTKDDVSQTNKYDTLKTAQFSYRNRRNSVNNTTSHISTIFTTNNINPSNTDANNNNTKIYINPNDNIINNDNLTKFVDNKTPDNLQTIETNTYSNSIVTKETGDVDSKNKSSKHTAQDEHKDINATIDSDEEDSYCLDSDTASIVSEPSIIVNLPELTNTSTGNDINKSISNDSNIFSYELSTKPKKSFSLEKKQITGIPLTIKSSLLR